MAKQYYKTKTYIRNVKLKHGEEKGEFVFPKTFKKAGMKLKHSELLSYNKRTKKAKIKYEFVDEKYFA